MSPRDYFAGLAMQSLLKSGRWEEVFSSGGPYITSGALELMFSDVALEAFQLADAMLKVRRLDEIQLAKSLGD